MCDNKAVKNTFGPRREEIIGLPKTTQSEVSLIICRHNLHQI
jgi:hypothetical protein